MSFFHFDTSHIELEMSTKILRVLKEWGIDRKTLSITLDNSSSNDSLIDNLRYRLNLQNALLCKGDNFHVRCCEHVLNLIVQNGSKVAIVGIIGNLEGNMNRFSLNVYQFFL